MPYNWRHIWNFVIFYIPLLYIAVCVELSRSTLIERRFDFRKIMLQSVRKLKWLTPKDLRDRPVRLGRFNRPFFRKLNHDLSYSRKSSYYVSEPTYLIKSIIKEYKTIETKPNVLLINILVLWDEIIRFESNLIFQSFMIVKSEL